ncbi:hypothetical protein [Granulosicoccus antarcticus]|uniref:Uncharacterized protein n=1 Tax=Granulosicoccus antarcticus IMCC3135 TaxID=1192854 RepID=A0A2Z2NXJ6_9GAMM|nr:hypothetical protein [Granulosicoccus antarcticus]ASJ72467.1 hypothetical protein IMCC3135_11885 [Granulosicoccus antarcticus IMCC3135]
MKRNVDLTRRVLLVLLLSTSAFASAQQKELSIDELEAYIAEQKVVLGEARANREKTQEKVDEVRDAISEQDARKALVEEELETLCSEQEALKPGTYEDCKAGSNN